MPLDLFGDFSFVGGEDTTANRYQDQQQCINYFVEASPAKAAKMAESLLGAPGLIQVAAAPGGGAPGFSAGMTQWPPPSAITNLPVRGSWVLPGGAQALVVIANVCYLAQIQSYGSLTTPGVLTLATLGTLNTLTGPVSIRDNDVGGYAVLVDGTPTGGYLYNITTQSFKQITDPAFLGANLVAYIDGWWIFNQPGTQAFYTNAAPYSTAFNGSLFALKDAASDKLMGVIENKEELWLPGERTTEIWYNAGNPFFAFQRLIGTMLQVGCKATYSIARLTANGQEGLIWFGRSERGENIVVRTIGFGYSIVSTPAVSNAIAQYTTTSDAIGYTYEEGAHEFYVLTFPTADRTWVLDATLPPHLAWHQRLSYDPYAAAFHRHRSNSFMNFGGMRVVGDYQNGALYQLTRAAYTDAGWPILARRRSPQIWNKENRERVFLSSLQVEFSPGQGQPSGLGSNPQATLRISRDYGSTYGPPVQAPMGAIGQYTNRCLWRKLGFSRGAVAELEVIDPISRDIVGVTLKAMGT
jgi:hypothetical protein